MYHMHVRVKMSAMNSSGPVAYIERSRAYYEAQGFAQAYRYAHFDSAPFTPMRQPLAASTVGLVTTASTYRRVSLEPRKIDSASTATTPQLYADDLSWDKQATHLEDINSFFPLTLLREFADQLKIGRLAPRFHCAATEYSHRMTMEKDAPEILRRLQEDQVDIALLVPL